MYRPGQRSLCCSRYQGQKRCRFGAVRFHCQYRDWNRFAAPGYAVSHRMGQLSSLNAYPMLRIPDAMTQEDLQQQFRSFLVKLGSAEAQLLGKHDDQGPLLGSFGDQ